MLKHGTWVTMITPFREDGQIDFDAIPALVDYYAAACDGIFAVCQSSEMFYLSLEERVELAKAVLKAANGRIPVIVSGHVSDDPMDQHEEIRRMAELGAANVVLVSNRLATAEESDEIWMRRANELMEAVPGAQLGVYECPYPYKRLMSDTLLRFCVESGRFAFLKDTCCNSEQIAHKIDLLSGSRLKLYNANSSTLLYSLQRGAAGFSGVMANFHPELYRYLTDHYHDRAAEAERLQGMLTIMSWAEHCGYPACAKLHLRMLGLPVNLYCRSGSHLRMPTDVYQGMAHLIDVEKRLCESLGVTRYIP